VSRPNAAQIRLLSFLALAPGSGFVDLVQLDQVRQIRAGDDLFVPTLVARGWAEHVQQRGGGVRITDAGRIALADATAGSATATWPGMRRMP